LKSDAIAAMTYTSNWWQIIANRSYFETAGRPELLRHLWSLAIEEQFYLFWPLILGIALKKLGRDRAPWAMIGVGLLSAGAMALLYTVGVNDYALLRDTDAPVGTAVRLGARVLVDAAPRARDDRQARALDARCRRCR